eukprot:6482926-Amphidinium_carterae.2
MKDLASADTPTMPSPQLAPDAVIAAPILGQIAAAAGLQLRGKRHPVFMPKFLSQHQVPSSILQAADVRLRSLSSPRTLPDDTILPSGSAIVPSNFKWGDIHDLSSFPNKVTIGVYRNPDQYVALALTKCYPGDDFSALDDSVKNVAAWTASVDPADVIKFRLKRVHDLRAWIDEQRPLQEKAWEAMHPDVRVIMRGKQTVALIKLLKALGMEDKYLEHGLQHGFSLVDSVPATGRGEPKIKEAAISMEEWKRLAPMTRNKVIGYIRPCDKDEDQELWQITCDERELGWLSPEMSVEEAIQKLGRHCVPARRFSVRQKEKVRPIDDYSVSLCNDLIRVHEKPFVQSLDVLVAQTRLLQHSMLSSKRSARLKGRSLDLDAAFRQLPVDPASAFAACVSLWSPSRLCPVVFEQRALPFGSVVSVHAFCRLSEAIRTLLLLLLMIVNSAFFDDFGMVDGEETCDSAVFAGWGSTGCVGREVQQEGCQEVAIF